MTLWAWVVLWIVVLVIGGAIVVSCVDDSPTRHRIIRPPSRRFISRGEAECLRVMRLLFPRHHWLEGSRPAWLLYDYPGRVTRPRPLELDIYCPELRLAVEYNGRQHDTVVPFFDGSDPRESVNKLWGRKQRDAWKERVCRERGVRLILVSHTVVHRDIYDYLREHPHVAEIRRQMI